MSSFKYFLYINICLLLISVLIFADQTVAQTNNSIKLVIDPGHGGRDPGNLKNNKNFLNEKDINLKIALKLGNLVDSQLENVKVIYTRKTDVFVSLEERAALANQKKADYFISIHCNSSRDNSIDGSEIHIHNNKCKESFNFASKLSEDLNKYTKHSSRGIKNSKDRNSNLLVIKSTSMPAVLIECGFMSNDEEERFLNSEKGQDLIAFSIYNSFKEFSKAKSRPECLVTYKVHFKSSDKKISMKSKEFKKLNMKIEEQIEEKSKLKYRYLAGNFCSLDEANALKNKLKDKGYKDAYVLPLKK